MFDSAKVYFPMTDTVCKRLRNNDAEHHGIRLYGNRFYLTHPFGYPKIAARISFDQKEISLETSLPKFLQGHNVFGSNRLEYLCLGVLHEIYQQLGLELTRREERMVRDKGIRLGRLDLVCSFQLESDQEATRVIELVLDQLKARKLPWAAYGGVDVETVYNRPNSTRVTDKFYNKSHELLKHRIRESVPERGRIQKLAVGLVRFELGLRGKQLVELDRCWTDQWQQSDVKEILMARIAKLDFQGVIREQLNSSEIEGLKMRERMVYAMWMQGVDLRKISNYAPVKSAREILRKRNIDVFRPRGIGAELPLNSILTADNAFFYTPKILKERGAIF